MVKTLEIHHNLSENHWMIIFKKFHLNPIIFEQGIKCKEEDHSITSLGVFLTWNRFWTKFIFTNDFRGLEDTIKHHILTENEKKIRAGFGKILKSLIIDLFLILRKLRFFWKIPFIIFASSLSRNKWILDECPLLISRDDRDSIPLEDAMSIFSVEDSTFVSYVGWVINLGLYIVEFA